MSAYVFQWGVVEGALPQLLAGAVVTLELTAASMAIGTAIAFPMAVVRSRGNGWPAAAVDSWVQVARNTPCLFQIYFAYFALVGFGINLDPFAATLLALTFNNVGYLTENFRGALSAIPAQQFLAGASLAMSTRQTYVHIVLPQAIELAWRPATNTLMVAMLNTSLGMIIGLQELSGAAAFASSTSFRTFEFFLVTAVLYYAIGKLVMMTADAIRRAWFGRRS